MDKDKKEKGGGGEMSEEFNDFLGIIIIIGFAIMFWNAFKAGKIKENTPTQQAQGVLQSQSASSTTTSNGPINSVQYIPAGQ